MKNLILAALLVAGFSILLLAVVASEASRADVYKSWSTKKCVKVHSTKAHHCHNLPKKYNTIWVK